MIKTIRESEHIQRNHLENEVYRLKAQIASLLDELQSLRYLKKVNNFVKEGESENKINKSKGEIKLNMGKEE